MKRRQFMAIPVVALAAGASPSLRAEADFVEFTEEGYEQALASGEPFMLCFLSSW